MYYLADRKIYDDDGYPVIVKSHLEKIFGKTLCGLKTSGYNWGHTYADYELKDWLIQKTTCKNCLKVAKKIKC